MQETVINGLIGGLGGALKSAFGAIKAARESSETVFDIRMTLVTIIEGAVAGIALGYALSSPVAAFFGGMGITELADLNDLVFPKTER